MLRALFELILTIIAVMIARAILTSIMRGIAKASSGGVRDAGTQPTGQSAPSPAAHTAGELRRDPVCGTYVAESTAFQRHIGGQTFYYCSEACREKHALVAR